MTITYHDSWKEFFELNNDLLNDILSKIDFTKTVFPKQDDIFKVFQKDINDIKVIIIGQDPYYKQGQANGLAFAVNLEQKIPPSLKNIFKAIKQQTNKEPIADQTLLHWYEQGVFLLNTSLTVIEDKPNCHAKYWKPFTNKVVQYVDNKLSNITFLLWGGNAKKLSQYITNNKYLESVHPSPLSAYHGFYNNGHFKDLDINW